MAQSLKPYRFTEELEQADTASHSGSLLISKKEPSLWKQDAALFLPLVLNEAFPKYAFQGRRYRCHVDDNQNDLPATTDSAHLEKTDYLEDSKS